MAYATDNPIKKIAEAGGNSVFFYIDGDAIGTIVGSGYFNSAYAELKQGDIIIVTSGIGGTIAADVLSVTSASGCLLYTSPSPRDGLLSRMPSSA